MNKEAFLEWNSWFYRAVFFLLIALLVFNKPPMPLPLQIRSSGHYRQIMKWPGAEGKVVSSSWKSIGRAIETGERRFCPVVEYTYVVDGRRYQGQNEAFEFACNPASFKYVVLKAGASIGIAYDPADPSISVIPDALLNPGFPWGRLIYTIVWAVALAIFLVSNVRYYVRLKRERIQDEEIPNG